MSKRRGIIILIFLLSIILVLGTIELIGGQPGGFARSWIGRVLKSPNGVSNVSEVYFPVITYPDLADDIELTHAWTGEPDGLVRDMFILGEVIEYSSVGINHIAEPGAVALTWDVSGPCGSSQVFSDTVSLSPGVWEHTFSDFTPECSGNHLGTVQVDYFGFTSTLSTTFEINLPSQIVTSTQQGFDRCILPTVNQMQTWWNSSPYFAWNIYLGGIQYACHTPELNRAWVQSVAQQGWQFILTWVGPQAPCSRYRERMSSVPSIAYSQGIYEAAAALAKAESLGIVNEKIIYYDLESYPDADSTCKLAVNAFIQGWTDEIHNNGDKAGVYAAPCYGNSNLQDWWTLNSPPPDDVWIAHWLLPAGYNPSASVNTPCLPADYWPGHRRLRQYFGDHTENWGGVSMSIDGNVLQGEINLITGTLTTTLASQSTGSRNLRIRTMDLVSPHYGWVLQDNRLLSTQDGGGHWRDITPEIGNGTILDAVFLDAIRGWAAVLKPGTSMQEQVIVFHTENGGSTWVSHPLSLQIDSLQFSGGIAGGYLDFLDEVTGFILITEPTGSSFSQGRLFATQDGGISWDERNAPLGGTFVFVDPNRGWMTGGPTGRQIFRTMDGGITWQAQQLPGLPETGVFIGQALFNTPERGYLPVTILTQPESKLEMYATEDGGETWVLAQTTELPPRFKPGGPLPTSLHQDKWWAGTPSSSRLYFSDGQTQSPSLYTPDGLPPGLVKLDFADRETGWALVQDGVCFGDKTSSNGEMDGSSINCVLETRLFGTQDGGYLWREIHLE